MPKGFPLTTCKDCRRPIANRSELSATGLCVDCGPRRQKDEITQLIAHHGPHFEKWRQRMAASVGARLLDADAESA